MLKPADEINPDYIVIIYIVLGKLKLDIPAADFYLKSLDYDLSGSKTIDAEIYVSHPINAFHLMKRTSTFMPLVNKKVIFLLYKQPALAILSFDIWCFDYTRTWKQGKTANNEKKSQY